MEKYQVNYQKEVLATKAYNEVLRKIKEIQAEQKELYKRSAKLEYNRNLLFNNIDGKVEDTRVCIEKIEAISVAWKIIVLLGDNILKSITSFSFLASSKIKAPWSKQGAFVIFS